MTRRRILPAGRFERSSRFADAYRWLTSGLVEEDDEVRAILLETLLDRRAAIALAALNVVSLAILAVVRTGETWGIWWFGAEVLLLAFRNAEIRRCGLARTAGAPPPYGRLIGAGLVWCAVMGAGCFACVFSGDPLLSAMAGIHVAAASGGLASRNAALPRLAIVQLLLCGLPYSAGCFFSPMPWFALLGLQTPIGLVAFISLLLQNHRDTTALIRAKRQNLFLARHDPLTGLGNRAEIESWLAEVCGPVPEAMGDRRASLVLCLDLDGFKDVNDQLGHAAGDQLLKAVAGRLRAAMPDRVEDRVGRLGGDEFVVIVDDLGDAPNRDFADRIIASVSRPYDFGSGRVVRIGVSIGSVVAQSGSATPDALLRSADEALYAAKRDGRGVHRVAA